MDVTVGISRAPLCAVIGAKDESMNAKRRILVVEDEAPILHGLEDLFTFHGYEVKSAADGREGLRLALEGEFDLIVLDVMLPSMDGFTVCNEIRSRNRRVPIIMLTAKSTEDDIITGLSLGADDYMAKPFSVRELVLRVEAILRRTAGDVEAERILTLADSLVIDCATLQGQPLAGATVIAFTRREVEILRYLLRHQDRPVSRGELLEAIWGYRKATEIETRTVDIHIAKLRKKIEKEGREPAFLVTVRGEGYRLLNASFGGRVA